MSSSHWNDLAASLGAEVKEEQPAAQAAPAAQSPSTMHASKKPVERKSVTPRPAANWSALASDLGIEVPPESARPAPTPGAPTPAARVTPEPDTDTVATPEREAEAQGGEPGEREARRRDDRPRRGRRGRDRDRRGRDDRVRVERSEHVEREEYASEGFAEEFSREEYVQEDSVDLELSVPTDSIDRVEGPDERAEGDEEDGARRRRRRRRGGRRSRRSREGRESAESGEAREDAIADRADFDEDRPLVPPELDIDPLAGIDTFDELEAEGGEELGESDAAKESRAEESGERRGRRRRRRRRGRGRKETTESAESEHDEDESGEDVAGGWGSTTGARESNRAAEDDGPEAQDGDSDEELIGVGDKNSHRAIPTWEEAIGYIVTVNMDSRTKNPGRSGSPRGGRGRRGRNGSRGGGNRSN